MNGERVQRKRPDTIKKKKSCSEATSSSNRKMTVEVEVHCRENADDHSDDDFVNTRDNFTMMRCHRGDNPPITSLPVKRKSFQQPSSHDEDCREPPRDVDIASTSMPKQIPEVIEAARTDKDVQGQGQVEDGGDSGSNTGQGRYVNQDALSQFSCYIDVASSPRTTKRKNTDLREVTTEETSSAKFIDSPSRRKSHVNKAKRSSKMSLKKDYKLEQVKASNDGYAQGEEETSVGNGNADSSRGSVPSPDSTMPGGGRLRFFRGTYDLFDSWGDLEDLEGVSFYENDGSQLKISQSIAKALGNKKSRVVLEKVDGPISTRSSLATSTSAEDNRVTEIQDIPLMASSGQASVIECSLESAFQDGGETGNPANMSQILNIKCEPPLSYADITGNGCGPLQDDKDYKQCDLTSSSLQSTLSPSTEIPSSIYSSGNTTSSSMMQKCQQACAAIAKPLTPEVAMVVLSSVVVDPEEARAIEATTRDQVTCEAWYFHRRGRITASNFANVATAVATGNEGKKASVVRRVLEDKRYSSCSWGIQHEQTALEAYAEIMRSHHHNFRLTRCGFVINPEFPHLGATPDSWAECSCCGRGVVEVKCPSGLPAFKSTKPNRCSFGFLNPHKRTKPLCTNALSRDNAYFYQVQGQMAVCEVDYCDFVCWTSTQIHIERIERDTKFLTSLKADLDSFYVCEVIPAILSDMCN